MNGHYLSTFGTTNLPWNIYSYLNPKSTSINSYYNYKIDDEKDQIYHIPLDIKNNASMTTLRVLSNVYVDRWKEYKNNFKIQQQKMQNIDKIISKDDEEEEEDKEKNILIKYSDIFEKYKIGKPLSKPILGKYFKLPEPIKFTQPIILDTTLNYIPIYSHLNIYPVKMIGESPKILEIIEKVKNLEFKKQN